MTDIRIEESAPAVEVDVGREARAMVLRPGDRPPVRDDEELFRLPSGEELLLPKAVVSAVSLTGPSLPPLPAPAAFPALPAAGLLRGIEAKIPGVGFPGARKKARFSGRFVSLAECGTNVAGVYVPVSTLELEGVQVLETRASVDVVKSNSFLRISFRVLNPLLVRWEFEVLPVGLFLNRALGRAEVADRSLERLGVEAAWSGRSISRVFVGSDVGTSPPFNDSYNGADLNRFSFPPVQAFPDDFRPRRAVHVLEILT